MSASSTSSNPNDACWPAKHRWLLTIIVFALLGPIIGGHVAIAGLTVLRTPNVGFSLEDWGALIAFPLTWMIAAAVGVPPALICGIAVSVARARGKRSIWHAAVIGAIIGVVAVTIFLANLTDRPDPPAQSGVMALVLLFLPSLVSTLCCWRLTRGLWEKDASNASAAAA
jgi:hypothetical protein